MTDRYARLRAEPRYPVIEVLLDELDAFLAGIVIAFSVPWLWGIVKPWIHAATGVRT